MRLLACAAVIQITLVRAEYFKPSWWERYALDRVRCDQITTTTQPFIGHDAFWDYAHVTYKPGIKLHTFPGVIVFLHAEDIEAFSIASRSYEDPFVLITRSNLDALVPYHSSHDQATLLPAYKAILQCPQLIHWFASNKVLRHPKLTGLPLGSKWQWHSTAFHGEDGTKGALLKVLAKHAMDVYNNFYGKPKPGLLFTSMTESSSDQAMYAPWRGSRRDAARALRRNFPSLTGPSLSDIEDIVDHDRLVSVGPCKTGRQSEDYLLTLQHYKFVLSPPGNGPDAHRTWEALLMGCIPVVISGPLDDLYVGLPVLIVKSWKELTPGNLRSAYDDLRYGQHQFAFERLFTPYWFGLIDMTIEQALNYRRESLVQ